MTAVRVIVRGWLSERWRTGLGLALLLGLMLAIPVTWLLAIIIAIGPGRAAARIAPATVLRTE